MLANIKFPRDNITVASKFKTAKSLIPCLKLNNILRNWSKLVNFQLYKGSKKREDDENLQWRRWILLTCLREITVTRRRVIEIAEEGEIIVRESNNNIPRNNRYFARTQKIFAFFDLWNLMWESRLNTKLQLIFIAIVVKQ